MGERYPLHKDVERAPGRPTGESQTRPAAGAGGEGSLQLQDALLLTPEEAARALRIGRTRMFSLLREGRVRSVTIGASRRVPVNALHEYVDELLQHSQREDRLAL